MKSSLIAIAAIMSAVDAYLQPHDAYQTANFYTSYVAAFNKEIFTTSEFQFRMKLFEQTSELIRKHNSARDISFWLAHN